MTVMIMFCTDYYVDEEFINEIPLPFEIIKNLQDFFNNLKGKTPNYIEQNLVPCDSNKPSTHAYDFTASIGAAPNRIKEWSSKENWLRKIREKQTASLLKNPGIVRRVCVKKVFEELDEDIDQFSAMFREGLSRKEALFQHVRPVQTCQDFLKDVYFMSS